MFNSPITSFLALKYYLEAQQFKGWVWRRVLLLTKYMKFSFIKYTKDGWKFMEVPLGQKNIINIQEKFNHHKTSNWFINIDFINKTLYLFEIMIKRSKMNTLNQTKINKLLQQVPLVLARASSWLQKQGYNTDLVRSYRKSQWLESLGNGAVKRMNDEVDYLGAVYCFAKSTWTICSSCCKTALILQRA